MSQLEQTINAGLKTEIQKDLHLANCEDCGCLIHAGVYDLHKKDKICKNKGVCGTCWKGYYDIYIQQENKKC